MSVFMCYIMESHAGGTGVDDCCLGNPQRQLHHALSLMRQTFHGLLGAIIS